MDLMANSILTEHFRHTVIEAGRADEPATGGRCDSAPVSFAWDRLPLLVAAGSLIATVALCVIGALT